MPWRPSLPSDRRSVRSEGARGGGCVLCVDSMTTSAPRHCLVDGTVECTPTHTNTYWAQVGLGASHTPARVLVPPSFCPGILHSSSTTAPSGRLVIPCVPRPPLLRYHIKVLLHTAGSAARRIGALRASLCSVHQT